LKHFIRLIILGLPLILVACSEEKSTSEIPIIDQWYTALKTSDRTTFDTMLAANARIQIMDLGITQTKAEFIEALDNWEEAAKELKLSHEIGKVNETSATVEVCYEFPSNSFTNEETFEFSDGKVVSQVQQQIEEGC